MKLVEDEMIAVKCASCEDIYTVLKDEYDEDELWFCEDQSCVRAAYKYHLGG